MFARFNMDAPCVVCKICVYLFCFCILTVETHRKWDKQDIKTYRDKVVAMFQHAYNGYLNYAYPYDELRPLTCDGQDTWGSFSLTLVDALDTLAVMGNYTEFRRVAHLLIDTSDFDIDINASVFETNIRIVGGLISAHLMSSKAGMQLEPSWPCSGPLLNMAENVARRLLPAFNTTTGMPYGTVNLRYGVPKGETAVTCTAGVGTFIVEFGALSRLTGDPVFERVAMKAMRGLWNLRSDIGLVGNHINVQTGVWTALDSGIGAGVDSYFEYLVKGSILFQIPEFMEMFKDYTKKFEIYLKRDDWYMWTHMKKGTITLPMFQSLEAFWPGLQSLVGDTDKAMKTIHNYHQVWKQYGFTPEFYNIVKDEPHQNREGYPLRPELIESAMYLYQATKDPFLLDLGADILESIEHSTKTKCGYATVKDVKNHSLDNRMESFFLAETTKYLYLLFDTENFIHNTGGHGTVINTPNGECIIDAGGYIFNTEAHPVDAAALYCCSAQRDEELMDLQLFQDQANLLQLLDLIDEEDSIYKAGKGRKIRKKNKVGDSENTQRAFEYDIEYTDVSKTFQENMEKEDTSESVILSVDEEAEEKHIEEIIGEKPDTESTETDDDLSTETSGEESETIDKLNKSESVDETETVVVTEKNSSLNIENQIKSIFQKSSRYKGDLFTCPAQPFHQRLSVLGEMFVDKTNQ